MTIFNAVLKEELSTIEKLKESEDLANSLFKIIDQSLSTKKLSNKTVRVIEKNKALVESLDSFKPKTQKEVYNPLINEDELKELEES